MKIKKKKKKKKKKKRKNFFFFLNYLFIKFKLKTYIG